MATKSIAIILGSSRNPRLGPHVVDLVNSILTEKADLSGVSLSVVDIATFNLPVFDESVLPVTVPKYAKYEKSHTIAWSTEIVKHDGYILVSPEYNFSVPGPVKNAIDFLGNEWKGKPMGIVTYGASGGDGASSALNHIFTKSGLKVAETRPQMPFIAPLGLDGQAAVQGKLVGELKKKWEDDHSNQIVKMFGEVKTLLNTTD